MQTLIIHKLGLNQNDHTFTLILLIKIVLFHKCPCTNSINHKCFEIRLGTPRRHFRRIVTKSTEITTYVYNAVLNLGPLHSRRGLTREAGLKPRCGRNQARYGLTLGRCPLSICCSRGTPPNPESITHADTAGHTCSLPQHSVGLSILDAV